MFVVGMAQGKMEQSFPSCSVMEGTVCPLMGMNEQVVLVPDSSKQSDTVYSVKQRVDTEFVESMWQKSIPIPGNNRLSTGC